MQEGRGDTIQGPKSFPLAPPAPSPLPFLFPSTLPRKEVHESALENACPDARVDKVRNFPQEDLRTLPLDG